MNSMAPENFDQLDRDMKRWKKKGLGYREAKTRLEYAESSVWPIAAHCASFIRDSWSRERIKKLGPRHRTIYNRLVADL